MQFLECYNRKPRKVRIAKYNKISPDSARFVQIRLRVGINSIKLYRFGTDLLWFCLDQWKKEFCHILFIPFIIRYLYQYFLHPYSRVNSGRLADHDKGIVLYTSWCVIAAEQIVFSSKAKGLIAFSMRLLSILTLPSFTYLESLERSEKEYSITFPVLLFIQQLKIW